VLIDRLPDEPVIAFGSLDARESQPDLRERDEWTITACDRCPNSVLLSLWRNAGACSRLSGGANGHNDLDRTQGSERLQDLEL